VFPWLSLSINNHQFLQVQRRSDQVADEVICAADRNALNQVPADRRSQAVVRLIASARKHLRAANVEASLRGGSDNEWTRYRDSQMTILSSLKETQRLILSEFTRKSLESDAAARTRLNEREVELKSRFKSSGDELARKPHGRPDGRRSDPRGRVNNLDADAGRAPPTSCSLKFA
jgi:hypothetical protein